MFTFKKRSSVYRAENEHLETNNISKTTKTKKQNKFAIIHEEINGVYDVHHNLVEGHKKLKSGMTQGHSCGALHCAYLQKELGQQFGYSSQKWLYSKLRVYPKSRYTV